MVRKLNSKQESLLITSILAETFQPTNKSEERTKDRNNKEKIRERRNKETFCFGMRLAQSHTRSFISMKMKWLKLHKHLVASRLPHCHWVGRLPDLHVTLQR